MTSQDLERIKAQELAEDLDLDDGWYLKLVPTMTTTWWDPIVSKTINQISSNIESIPTFWPYNRQTIQALYGCDVEYFDHKKRTISFHKTITWKKWFKFANKKFSVKKQDWLYLLTYIWNKEVKIQNKLKSQTKTIIPQNNYYQRSKNYWWWSDSYTEWLQNN